MPTYQLVERDIAIAYSVGRMSVATAEDVARLCFSGKFSLVTARRRLRKLVSLRVLAYCPPRNPVEPGSFVLTPVGRRWLIEQQGVETSEVVAITSLAHLNTVHLRTVNRMRVHCSLATRAHPDVALRAFVPERELRVVSRAQNLDFVPDALVTLAFDGSENTFALEADVGGNERFATWRQKGRAYAEPWHRRRPLFGCVPWALLVLVQTERRARTLARLLREEGAGLFAGIGIEAKLDEQRLLENVWLRASDEHDVSLPELVAAWGRVTPRPDSTPSQGEARKHA